MGDLKVRQPSKNYLSFLSVELYLECMSDYTPLMSTRLEPSGSTVEPEYKVQF